MMSSKLLILVWVTTTTTLVLCLGGVVVEGFKYEDKEVETEAGRAAMFERWRSHHKLEALNKADKQKQYDNFKAKLEVVHATNKAGKSYKLEMNRFAGMSHQELMSKHAGLKYEGRQLSSVFGYRNFTEIPPKIDWRAIGATGKVRNQGGCGSCAMFAAVEAVDGLHFIKHKEPVHTSPKEILDCANIGGCDGSFFTSAFEYVAKHGGLTTDANYPYKPEVEPCNVKKENDIAVEVHGCESFGGEKDLYKVLANQPVSCAVMWGDDMGQYREGIYDGPCGTIPIHAIAVVGWDETPEGEKYWIIKNSWGEDWGEKGYMRLKRDAGGEGHCGVSHWCAYPTLESTGKWHKPDDEVIVQSSKDL